MLLGIARTTGPKLSITAVEKRLVTYLRIIVALLELRCVFQL